VNTTDYRPRAVLRRLLATSSETRSRVDDLARRVEHMEAALEGLQDAMYRQDVVHDGQIADLRERHATKTNGRRRERP
jgi:hypothetical protein